VGSVQGDTVIATSGLTKRLLLALGVGQRASLIVQNNGADMLSQSATTAGQARWGRAGTIDGAITAVGAADQGVTGSVQGDTVIATSSTSRRLLLGLGVSQRASLIVQTSGVDVMSQAAATAGQLRMGRAGTVDSAITVAGATNDAALGSAQGDTVFATGANAKKILIGAGVSQTPAILVGQNAVGFHGTTPVAQQTITGSRGSNAALADLLTKLAAKGLVVDSTTA
jgi:hypothetical protein